MNRDRALQRYDLEMRARPYLPPELTTELRLGVLRITGHYNCIVYTDLTEADADAAIDAQAAFFEALGQEVEWKVHGHDRPADLGQRLAARGFAPEPAETLLALDLGVPLPVAPAVDIRRIVNAGGLDDYVSAVSAGFESDRSAVRQEFAGRVDLPPQRPFAGLYTGAVAPAFRGRGIYRALVEARVEAARTAGHAFAMVEALETSRPILQRLGFMPLTTVQGWMLKPRGPTA